MLHSHSAFLRFYRTVRVQRLDARAIGHGSDARHEHAQSGLFGNPELRVIWFDFFHA